MNGQRGLVPSNFVEKVAGNIRSVQCCSFPDNSVLVVVLKLLLFSWVVLTEFVIFR